MRKLCPHALVCQCLISLSAPSVCPWYSRGDNYLNLDWRLTLGHLYIIGLVFLLYLCGTAAWESGANLGANYTLSSRLYKWSNDNNNNNDDDSTPALTPACS